MNEKQFETQALQLRGQYDQLVVTNDESAAAMTVYEETARDAAKAIKDHMKPVIEDAREKHKKLIAVQKRLVDPFDMIRAGAREQRLDYQREQERIAAEKQRKLEDEARKKREQELRAAEAFKTEEKVEEIKAEPIRHIIVKPSVTSKVKGARTLWHAEIENVYVLIGALARDPVLCGKLFNVGTTEMLVAAFELNKLAVREKDKLDIPGVKAVSRLV